MAVTDGGISCTILSINFLRDALGTRSLHTYENLSLESQCLQLPTIPGIQVGVFLHL